MGTIRDLFVQTETFVLFLACITVKNRLSVPLPLERGLQRKPRHDVHYSGVHVSRPLSGKRRLAEQRGRLEANDASDT
jgi:hypothetical protein